MLIIAAAYTQCNTSEVLTLGYYLRVRCIRFFRVLPEKHILSHRASSMPLLRPPANLSRTLNLAGPLPTLDFYVFSPPGMRLPVGSDIIHRFSQNYYYFAREFNTFIRLTYLVLYCYTPVLARHISSSTSCPSAAASMPV